MPSATSASLNGPAAGCPSGSSSSSTPSGSSGETTVSQRCSPHRHVVLLQEPEHLGVERQGLGLVVDENAGQMLIFMVFLRFGRGGPAVGDGPQRGGVQVVELVAAAAPGVHQAGRFKDLEVLGDCLPGQADALARVEPGAEFEKGLPGALCQFIQDGPAGGVGDGLVHVGVRLPRHATKIGKQRLACQALGRPAPERPAPGSVTAGPERPRARSSPRRGNRGPGPRCGPAGRASPRRPASPGPARGRGRRRPGRGWPS